METTKMSASFFIFILIVIIQGKNEAAPARDYGGVLHPISGAVPVSVPRRRQGAINEVLREIRSRVDKSLLEELDSSIRNDILQDNLRDVVEAVIRDVQGIGQGALQKLPLVPNVINGVAEAITYIICGVEDGLSDVISGFDDGPDILTKVLVDLIELNGSAPLKIIDISYSIRWILERFIKAAFTTGVICLGVKVGHDIGLGIEQGVGEVVNAVKTGAQMIGGGVRDGVGSIAKGIKGGIGDIVGIL
ncbi:hypothetical protein HNY73_001887 [Argiope bruennichi]|uniref:Uncharacterized protein n=1 Tax=Argiope bruennichi TaxID=94029 RepID=A0A8T0FT92_ARGBR|nr:hypothetical protein HNY73_001887 [Argiope bruennichi]